MNVVEQKLLEEILSQGLIETLFQPIIDINNQSILGYEALSRGPEGSSLYSPLNLFKFAEECGRLSELELLCRKNAIKQFARLALPGKLFLNVSPSALLDNSHPKGQTLAFLKQHKLATKRIVIEVTEREPFAHSDLLKATISHYRSLGFNIAIDDFGAGYSGLKQWSELEPDLVKIDRYFIDQCDKSIVKKEFLRSILELAKITNTRVIAEGIERPEELRLLQKLGVSLAQGFLLEKPAKQPIKTYCECAYATELKVFKRETPDYHKCVGSLLTPLDKISNETRCGEAQRLFQNNKKQSCFVVVDKQNYPVGILYREQLAELFATAYGHALNAKNTVSQVMDSQPLVVDHFTLCDDVSTRITEHDFDIRRHIIVTKARVYSGVVPVRDILKYITNEKINNAQHANPLTMLPGNVAINQTIEQHLNNKDSFELAYIDLNHFKQFNDLYGYASGDMVIKLLAEIITQACQNNHSFVGHIGGDDFMLVCEEGIGEVLCNTIITQFEHRSRSFFTPEHIEFGGYWATNREGQKQFVPLLTLSIGLVNPDVEYCENSHQVAALATDAKKEAKRYRESHLFICKRRRPTMPLIELPIAK